MNSKQEHAGPSGGRERFEFCEFNDGKAIWDGWLFLNFLLFSAFGWFQPTATLSWMPCTYRLNVVTIPISHLIQFAGNVLWLSLFTLISIFIFTFRRALPHKYSHYWKYCVSDCGTGFCTVTGQLTEEPWSAAGRTLHSQTSRRLWGTGCWWSGWRRQMGLLHMGHTLRISNHFSRHLHKCG